MNVQLREEEKVMKLAFTSCPAPREIYLASWLEHPQVFIIIASSVTASICSYDILFLIRALNWKSSFIMITHVQK